MSYRIDVFSLASLRSLTSPNRSSLIDHLKLLSICRAKTCPRFTRLRFCNINNSPIPVKGTQQTHKWNYFQMWVKVIKLVLLLKIQEVYLPCTSTVYLPCTCPVPPLHFSLFFSFFSNVVIQTRSVCPVFFTCIP